MYQFRLFIAYILLIAFMPQIVTPTLYASDEDITLHSLDELPSMREEPRVTIEPGVRDRAAMLDLLDHSAETIAEVRDLEKTITREIPIIERETISLIAERSSYVTQAENLSIGFIGNPFSVGGSGSSFLSPFLAVNESQSVVPLLNTPTEVVESESILPSEKKTRIEVKQKVYQKKVIPGISGSISYQMISGTVITGASGEIIDTTEFGLSSIDTTKKLKAKAKYEKKMKNRGNKRKGMSEAQVSGFEFGLSGSHLIFSKPVMLTIDASHMSDGNVVDLMTMHAGDTDFHTGGLSLSANTVCNPDGSTSISGSQAIVKNGKVTFYTCGASLFTMNPTGGTTGSNDLRIVIGDCAQAQIYYNNLQQAYTGNPPATGCT
jgi:hypothetical protein